MVGRELNRIYLEFPKLLVKASWEKNKDQLVVNVDR